MAHLVYRQLWRITDTKVRAYRYNSRLFYFYRGSSLRFELSLSNLACERDERMLFEGVSAQYGSGDIIQIAGPNGAGKTSLLKMLVGIVPVSSGDIAWTQEGGVDAATLRESLLYIGHHPAVKASLTAMENLQWFFGLNGRKSLTDMPQPSREDYCRALSLVGLVGYEDVLCHQMSAGQQRRVALARLYLSHAPLWILDEPFTAIDKRGVAALEDQISLHARRGGLILLTTHQAMALDKVKRLDLSDYLPIPVDTGLTR